MAVVDQGSFSKAAARCNISQSNLSEQVQKLESRVGKPLLNRSHRLIVPTDAGNLLLRRATRILALIEKAKQEIRSSDGIHAGKVSFGVLPTIAPCFLALVLGSFVERHPKIQVFVHENTTEQSLQLIETGKLDLGLVSLPVREHGFETETLFSEEMLLALHPRHPLTRKRQIFTEDLLSEKFILSQEDHYFSDYDHWLWPPPRFSSAHCRSQRPACDHSNAGGGRQGHFPDSTNSHCRHLNPHHLPATGNPLAQTIHCDC